MTSTIDRTVCVRRENVRYRTLFQSVTAPTKIHFVLSKNLVRCGPGHCEDMHLDHSILQRVETRDEKRTTARTATTTGPGRSDSDCGVWCEGNMAGRLSALSTRSTRGWSVHRSRRSRTAAQPDQSRTRLRADHCNRRSDIRERRTFARQHVCHRCECIGGNHNSFSEQREISRVRSGAPWSGIAASVAGDVGAGISTGKAARARRAQRRSAADVDAFAPERGPYLHDAGWPSQAGQLTSPSVVRDGRRDARVDCARSQSPRLGGDRGARRNDVPDPAELFELEARERRDDKISSTHPGAAETRVPLTAADSQ